MNDQKVPVTELIFLTASEVVVSALTLLVYILLDKFSYRAVTGVLLGSVVTILNFIFLSLSVNRAIDNVMAERGSAAMDDGQAAEFAAKHKSALSKTIQLSGTVRTVSIIVVLSLAFILDRFDVIATLIPIVAFRPLLILGGLIKKNGGN